MARLETARDALAGSFGNRRLWLIQFLANPILFALFAAWLLIPEARTWQLVLSVLFGAGIVGSALVLHAGTLNYFCDHSRSKGALLKSAFGRALLHIAAIAVWVGIFYLIWRQVDRLDLYRDEVPTYIRSMLPAFLRRHITLGAMTGLFDGFIWGLRWIVTPGLLLPLASEAANRGFRGLRRAGFSVWKGVIASLEYWIVVVLAAVAGVFVSPLIVNWTPRSPNSTLAGETVSVIGRLLVAYLLGLSSWMLACSMIGRRSGLREKPPGDAAG